MKLDLNDPRLLLLYKGNVTPSLIEWIIESLEQSVTNLEEDRKVKKKLTNVFVEAFQNVGNHSEKSEDLTSADVILVLSMEDYYKVTTQNLVDKAGGAKMAAKINLVNTYNDEELREQYKKSLVEGEFSDKGTAGLGFIDMARKSGEKLRYKIQPFSDTLDFFVFEARIPKHLEERSGDSEKATRKSQKISS
ncbi:MAG: hypothetical protein ACI8QD_002634 [Cyclobacteriaceae bacterium]|jgi:hypothetical protein